MHRVRLLAAAVIFQFSAVHSHGQPLAGAGPGSNAAGSVEKSFQVKGVVKEVKPDEKSVVIQHEAVPGYMPAMTMPFDVRDTNELRGVQPGDVVSFRMTVTDSQGWIDHILRVAPGKGELPSRGGLIITRDIDPLAIGDALPDYHFTNEFGRAVSTGQFKGGPLVFTFFFTSCPYPNFCPLLSRHFADTEEKLLAMTNAPAKWHLLSISFDPGVDTPETLRNYASAYHYEPGHWSFVTGDMSELLGICDQVGEQFSRSPETGVTHNLRTVVVDARGRVQRIFHNNDWTADELVEEILKASKP